MTVVNIQPRPQPGRPGRWSRWAIVLVAAGLGSVLSTAVRAQSAGDASGPSAATPPGSITSVASHASLGLVAGQASNVSTTSSTLPIPRAAATRTQAASPAAKLFDDLPPLPPEFPAGNVTRPTASAPPQPAADPVDVLIPPATTDNEVEMVGCATCGGTGLAPSPGGVRLSGCTACGGAGCVPGRKQHPPFQPHTFFGHFCANLYECLCCPDPCYEPSWIPAANAAFFVDFARPRTLQRFRWDRGWGMSFPDRNEYFWARQQLTGPIFPGIAPGKTFKSGGRGPAGPPILSQIQKRRGGKLRYPGVPQVSFDEASYYQEAATGRASFFTEFTYRAVSPTYNAWHSGFSNINLGTKALLVDCELIQLTFQFKTYIPIGAANKGLSNGHVSLEPSLLTAIRLAPQTYFQAQLSEWIPIGGDLTYAGDLLHYHFSFNQVLHKFAEDSPLIGTMEFSGWTFQDGAYTNPYSLTPQGNRSSGMTYFNIGPGIRASICDAIDFGTAVTFPVTDHYWANPWLRVELRILF